MTRIESPTLRPTPTRSRETPPDARTQFRAALAEGARSALSGLEAAVPFLPTGLVANAAVRDRSASRTGASGVEAGRGGDVAQAAQSSANDALELLSLQQRIGDEQRRYTTLSNVMKARHETQKNVLGNLR